MYPVSVLTYVLNILDTFNTGVTEKKQNDILLYDKRELNGTSIW